MLRAAGDGVTVGVGVGDAEQAPEAHQDADGDTCDTAPQAGGLHGINADGDAPRGVRVRLRVLVGRVVRVGVHVRLAVAVYVDVSVGGGGATAVAIGVGGSAKAHWCSTRCSPAASVIVCVPMFSSGSAMLGASVVVIGRSVGLFTSTSHA